VPVNGKSATATGAGQGYAHAYHPGKRRQRTTTPGSASCCCWVVSQSHPGSWRPNRQSPVRECDVLSHRHEYPDQVGRDSPGSREARRSRNRTSDRARDHGRGRSAGRVLGPRGRRPQSGVAPYARAKGVVLHGRRVGGDGAPRLGAPLHASEQLGLLASHSAALRMPPSRDSASCLIRAGPGCLRARPGRQHRALAQRPAGAAPQCAVALNCYLALGRRPR
jgi:hypothetical protein